jgi:ATP-dependent Clp protease ATP-binding subunit ClpC
LFDEIEKGNFEIYNLLLQILEDGMITDGKGRKINFKNTIIVMTSNIGSDEFTDKATQIGFETTDDHRDRIIEDYDRIKAKILEDLDEHFVPEFINRIDKVVVFNPLDKKNLKRIISLQLDDLHERLLASNVESSYDRSVVDFILKEVYNARYGARPVRRFIQEKIEDPIADIVITRTA